MLVLPFKGLYKLTQEFGVNADNYKQFLVLYSDGIRRPMAGHNGLDFGCPYRTEIIAPHAGKIIEASSDPVGYGFYIKIEDDTQGSVLGHLDTIDVKVGDSVPQSTHLGWSDSTGNSTANHLHWGYYKFPRNRSNGYAGFIDQTSELANSGIYVKLGELPTMPQPVLKEGDRMYKGLDTTNIASVKAAVDAWYDVANGLYVSVEKYGDINTKLKLANEQLNAAKNENTLLVSDEKNYAELKARGYATVEDVTRVIDGYDKQLRGAQKQLIDVQKDNETVHQMLADKEKQDYTAIEEGMHALEQNKELKETVAVITKAVGADRPAMNVILDKITMFRDIAEKVFKKQDEEEAKKSVMSPANAPVQEPQFTNAWDWLSYFLTPPSSKGVKEK